jgi:hypothetical protein
VPANSHSLSQIPAGNGVAQGIDDADDFVPWNAGILNSGEMAALRERVTMANSAGLHFDANLSRFGFRDLTFDELEFCSRPGNLRGLHRSYGNSCGCHGISFHPQCVTIFLLCSMNFYVRKN